MIRNVSILVALVVFFGVSSLFAKPLAKDKALKAAENFLVVRYRASDQNSIRTINSRGRSAFKAKGVQPLIVSGKVVGYFTNLEPAGYILFSADDQTPPIKIYSDNGSFEKLPDDLKSVLELELLEDNTSVTSNKIRTNSSLLKSKRFSDYWNYLTADANQNGAEPFPASAPGIAILTTRWDQDSPYNYYAPAVTGGPGGRALAGCVATALAQILRYHNFPASVTSDHTYTDSWGSCQGTHSISDAGMLAYNWASMPVSISTSSSTVQKQAVGQLIYHCGVALESNYEADATSAKSTSIPSVLRTYFDYTCGDYLQKGSYTDAQWYAKIQSNIDNDKPIFYAMFTSDGINGHAVVCDGYRNGNEMHLNLGWSGAGTAWYNLDSVSAGGHTWTIHSAVFNITPATHIFAYSGGTGSLTDPYRIATKADLLALAANAGDYGKCFILTVDIDLGGQVFTSAIIGGTSFWGIFDGNSHKIINFTIDGIGDSFLGLFKRIDAGCSVKNLGLENFAISGSNTAGAVVGLNHGGNISNCYSIGSVSVLTNCAGGIAGSNYFDGIINNCYSMGLVEGWSDSIGGLVGINYGSVANCYSTAQVNGLPGYVGGLLYLNVGIVTNSFWDTQASGQTTSGGGAGKTTAEMKTLSTFTTAGWDFSTLWTIVPGQTYPFFKRATYSGGTGIPSDPYRIARAEDLFTLAATTGDYSKCFILTADIDLDPNILQRYVFTNALIAPDTSITSGFQGTAFTGKFDGSGHKILHLTIKSSNSYIGLFGQINSGGSVKNLGLENCSVSGASFTGGLAGCNNYGNISNCYSTGSIIGAAMCQNVGGLVGYNSNGNISNSYSTNSVSGTSASQYAGGLVGYNGAGSNISNCYSTGKLINWWKYQGGLVGYNVGIVSSSFWDTQTSMISFSSGGIGETTSQMKTLFTFTSSGWDFTNETANGANDYWRMCVDGIDYPRLKWESLTGDFACPDGVNSVDFAFFVERWLMGNCQSQNNCSGVDLNVDGIVNMKDFAIFASHWLESF